MTRLLIDAGPIVALLSQRDAWHERCCDVAATLTAPPLTTWSVLTEAAWLLRRDNRGVDNLLKMVSGGDIEVVELNVGAADWVRVFLDSYRDLSPQLADATLVHLAQTLGIETVFTLDRRDFTVFRLASGDALKILPE